MGRHRGEPNAVGADATLRRDGLVEGLSFAGQELKTSS